jgi:hypothetical protein
MKRGGLFWGVVLLLIGLLLLLSNLDIISIDLWSAIWAVVLIAVGLGILWSVLAGPQAAQGEEISIPLGDAMTARLRLEHAAGRLQVKGGAEAGLLLEGTFSGGADYRARHEGDEIVVDMSPRGFPHVMAPWHWGSGGLTWAFGLNNEIPLFLTLKTGASDTRLDLSELQVTDLRLEAGASSVSVTLPAGAGHTRVRIEAGAASISVRVPPDVAARVRFEGALASVDIDRDRFPRKDGVYQSPHYETAQNKVDIEADAGVGSFRVS